MWATGAWLAILPWINFTLDYLVDCYCSRLLL
jgi:hypothetical protein